MLKPSVARSLLAGFRVVIGIAGLLAPRFGARLFGLRPEDNPGLPYTMRLFAVRDVALGVGLAGADPRDRHRWVDLGLASDASDAVASVLGGRSGALDRRAATLTGAAALFAVALGVAARGSDA